MAGLRSQAGGIRGTAETWLSATAVALVALTAIIGTAMIRAIVRPLDSQLGTMRRLTVVTDPETLAPPSFQSNRAAASRLP